MNIAHIFETAIFILATFLIGAILGYLIRCMFFRPKAATTTPMTTPSAIAATTPKTKPIKSKPTVAKVAAAKPATTKATSPKPATADADGKPIGLSGPRAGKKDNLKRIKGIGPKIEVTLNDLGIYHFDQVGGWSSKTVEWVNGFISFKGRIQREKWISQAKALGQGKSTEFSNRVDKGRVPSSKK